MNKFITKVFKSAGVNAKVSRDTESPRFKVVDNALTLEGLVTSDRYTMTIKDNKGKTVDNLSVSIDNSNDIVNRINESLGTLKMLSSVYDKQQITEDEDVEEDDEFEDVVIDEDAPVDMETGLEELYDAILDVAEKAEQLTDLADDEDADQLNTIIGFASSLYDCAIDVADYKDDLFEEEEEMDESVKKVRKSDLQKVLDNLTIAESVLKKNKVMKDIAEAIKDVKSELIVRGK